MERENRSVSENLLQRKHRRAGCEPENLICSGESRERGLSVTEHTLSVHSIPVPRTAATRSGFPEAPLTPVSPRALHHHWVAQGLRFIDHFRKVFMPTCQEKARINKVLAMGQRLAQHLPP